MPFRGFIAPVVLKDGVIEVRSAGFKSPDYLATANLFLDLATYRLDSEWLLAWRGKSKVPTPPLAPVRLVFAGPLADFTRLHRSSRPSNMSAFCRCCAWTGTWSASKS